MRKIRVGKVVLNIGCGGNLEKIEKAKKLIEYLTNRKPVVTLSRKRSTFGISKGKPIGVKVTLRKKVAIEFLKKALTAVENKLKENQINAGNFSFGIKNYIDITGVKYRHDIGNMGMDVCVYLSRAGFNVRKIGKNHLITKEETLNFLKEEFNIEIV